MTDVLTTLKAEGRRLGVVTAKRRETVRLASLTCRWSGSSTSSSAPTTPTATSRTRHRSSTRSGCSAQAVTSRSTSATRPSTSARQRAPGCTRSPSRGAASTPRAARGRRAGRRRRVGGGALPPSEAQRKRAAAPEQLHHHNYRYHVLDDRRSRTPRIRPSLRRVEGASRRNSPRLDRRLADPAWAGRLQTSSRRSSIWRRWGRSRR